MTEQDKHWHKKYEEMSDKDKFKVDDLYTDIEASLCSEGYTVKGDDRAEQLVAALARYIITSKE